MDLYGSSEAQCMGLPDTYDVLWQCDRWLLLGAPRRIPNQLYKAVEEQGWKPNEFLPELLERWMRWTQAQARLYESAAYTRGYGWRIWYPLSPPQDSVATLWKDLANGFVGGVVYLGGTRRILQGKDPFYLEGGLPRACQTPNELVSIRDACWTQPKMGTWVTDEQMADFRRSAIFAFGLE